jgi:serine phosphatase RsbU (regulator of sigma subunit)
LSRNDSHDEHVTARAPAGLGLAARFVLGLGLLVTVIATVAGYALWVGAQEVAYAAGEQGQRALARRTGELLRDGVLEGNIVGRSLPAPEGVDLQTAQATLRTSDAGEQQAKVFQVSVSRPAGPSAESGAEGSKVKVSRLLYAPSARPPLESNRLIVLILLVCGGMVVATVAVGAFTARKVAEPLRSIVDDVSAISRGRLDRRVHVDGAPKEVTYLARAVDRMVQDLVAGQADRDALDLRQREADSLRELRRNLRPMRQDAPYGFSIETLLIESDGAGSGDFVDSLRDEAGHSTLVVGSTATRGMPGALLMAMTRAYLRGAVLQGVRPAAAFDQTNASLNRDLARGLFASAIALWLDSESGAVELVSAGHKAPAVRWDAAAGQLRKLQPNGIALGFDKGPIFRKSLETLELTLAPGDAVLLFSPNVFECTSASGKALGESGVYALAKIGIESGLDAMEAKLRHFLGGEPGDDLAFALLRDNRFDQEPA